MNVAPVLTQLWAFFDGLGASLPGSSLIGVRLNNIPVMVSSQDSASET